MSKVTSRMNPAIILLIGSGKLAKHLSHWFSLTHHHHQLLTWDRHQDPQALRRYVTEATHIWLAVSDSAIVPFYEKYLAGHDAVTIHFSGALHDPRLISAHPLMSFSENIYPDEFYSKIYFALTGCEKLSEALPGFNNPSFVLNAETKPLYHALCVVAGNFPQLLWNEVNTLAADKKIPAAAFDLYIQQITQNFLSLKKKALTGPFIRQDIQTINKNIEALSGTQLQMIYKSFEKEFLK